MPLLKPVFWVIVAAGLALAAAASAASEKTAGSGEVFQDLPGVRPLGAEEPKYKCSTVTRHARKRNDIKFFDSDMPYLAYRCERDGYVFEGTRPPASWQWAPGINPHDLPK
ncbi:hypothetical protein M8R20_03020 [Pseudomonas sp. R2.Fl]|nr:hypothetical protein [Pseudomonas sp. R2.Fl]